MISRFLHLNARRELDQRAVGEVLDQGQRRDAASQADVDNWRYQRDTAQANLRSDEQGRVVADR